MLKLGREPYFTAIMEGIMLKRIFLTICIFIMVGIIPGGISSERVTAQPLDCSGGFCFYLPILYGTDANYYFPLILSEIPETALIINHNNIDITQIPDYWLAQARTLTIHYGQTSHGSQILSGLDYWEDIDGLKYNYAISPGATPPTLPAGTDLLKIYTGNNYDGNTYVTPDMYWDGSTGIEHTTSTAATGLFDYSMWSWCGQADTSDASYINEYLTQMSAFETAFPAMQFILMTGHNVGNPGTNLLARNQQMRDYAIANDMVLFDFADIETYTPDGTFYDPAIYNYSDGGCPWCTSWCASHTSYCTNLPSCAHTHGLFCKMKAQAFWWMMARLAGWNGVP
jgi:hypothetical protein